jgi:hypothetical protein
MCECVPTTRVSFDMPICVWITTRAVFGFAVCGLARLNLPVNTNIEANASLDINCHTLISQRF